MGKDFDDVTAIWRSLDSIKIKYDDMVLLHGGGPGAEKIAASWAEKNGVHQVVCKPNWERSGPPVPVPVRLAHHLVDAVALGPLGGDALDAGAAAVAEDDVFVLALSSRAMTAPGSLTCLPPAMATRVPWGRCARVSRSLRARRKSRASMAAEVSLPVCETWEPRRGRQVSPVSARWAHDTPGESRRRHPCNR